MGIDIYDIHGYFRELTVGQWIPGFSGITKMKKKNFMFNFIIPFLKFKSNFKNPPILFFFSKLFFNEKL